MFYSNETVPLGHGGEDWESARLLRLFGSIDVPSDVKQTGRRILACAPPPPPPPLCGAVWP